MSTLIGNAYDIPSFGYGADFSPIIGPSGDITGQMQVSSDLTTQPVFWSPATGLEEIGLPTGCSSGTAEAIDSTDDVVGWAYPCANAASSQNEWAFRWSPSSGFQVLPSPPSSCSSQISFALAINQGRVIAGSSENCSGSGELLTRWHADGSVEVGTIPGFFITSVAEGFDPMIINGNNQVAGTVAGSSVATGQGAEAGFFWDGGSSTAQMIGTLGGDFSIVTGLNSHGTITGFSRTPAGFTHAFRWTATGGMQDLGTLGGVESRSVGVADDESIAGWSYTSAEGGESVIHTFRWTPTGGMTDLGLLPNSPTDESGFAIANGMSSSGIITGYGSVIATGGIDHAFRWTPQNGMEDLGVLAGGQSQGVSVNDRGEVAGFYFPSTSGLPDWARWNAPSGTSAQTASLTLANLAQVYDGLPKFATVLTAPTGLTGVRVQYSQAGAAVATPIDAGSYDVVASLDNPDYQASPVQGVLVISQAPQVITFAPIGDHTLTDAPFTLSATGGASGVAVTFASNTPSVCAVSGTIVTLAAVGTCTIEADQAGSQNYKPALPVDRSFQVTYPFSGFVGSVASPPTVNVVRAGGSVPIVFSLGGNQGLGILAAGSPTSGPIACDASALVESTEPTSSAGSAGLQYDASTGQYTYVWKTAKQWAGTCRALHVEFVDGRTYTALFRFR